MILFRAYATLWDWVNDMFGTQILSMPPNMYGMMMAIAFVVGVSIAYRELSRRTSLGIFERGTREITVGQGPKFTNMVTPILMGYFIGLKVGGYFTDYQNFSYDPQRYLLSLSGNKLWGLLGAFLLGGYEYYQIRRKQLPTPKVQKVSYNAQDRIFDILLLAMVGGVLGSKILDAIENPASMQELITNPIMSLTSGLSVLGGLWLATLLIVIYGRKHRLNILALTDSLAPAFFLAYAVGRLGCQFSGDGCWGIPTTGYSQPSWVPDFLWGHVYAHNVNNEGIPIPGCMGNYCSVLAEPHFPTPLYEFLSVVALFLILWAIRIRWTHHIGMITGIFMIMNGIERLMIEFIRENTKYKFIGLQLSQAQYISIVMILAGLVLSIWAYRKHEKNNSILKNNHQKIL